MLPCLRAQESLLDSSRIAVGMGSLSEEDARVLTTEWSDAASVGSPRTPRVRLTPDELRQRGVNVIRVPRKAKAS